MIILGSLRPGPHGEPENSPDERQEVLRCRSLIGDSGEVAWWRVIAETGETLAVLADGTGGQLLSD